MFGKSDGQSDFKNRIKRQHNAMHLKGNWLDKSFSSFIDFPLQDQPQIQNTLCANLLKLHSKSFAKTQSLKCYTISFVAGDQVHPQRGQVSLPSIQTGMPQRHHRRGDLYRGVREYLPSGRCLEVRQTRLQMY